MIGRFVRKLRQPDMNVRIIERRVRAERGSVLCVTIIRTRDSRPTRVAAADELPRIDTVHRQCTSFHIIISPSVYIQYVCRSVSATH